MIEEVTEQFLSHLQNSAGGYTQRAFSLLGVDKPESGWEKEIIGKLISVTPDDFEQARFSDAEWKDWLAQLERAGIYDLLGRRILIQRSSIRKRKKKQITRADGRLITPRNLH